VTSKRKNTGSFAPPTFRRCFVWPTSCKT